jgi:hypothetical protein
MIENECRHLEKLETEEEIQIGWKTFPLMLIKWKHKKRMYFEIETMRKILAHLIRLNCCQLNDSRGLLFKRRRRSKKTMWRISQGQTSSVLLGEIVVDSGASL